MSDIISAKCFGCGHVVKVPGALGGKKARCPKCTNTITIPSPTDTATDDVVSDEELPEVARDDEVLDGLPVEEEAPPEPASREPRPRPGSSSAHRRVSPAGGRPPQGARGAPPRRGAPRKGSSTGLIRGLVGGVLALIAIIAAAASGGRKPPPPKPADEGAPQAGRASIREETEADRQLKEQVRGYISEFNRRNIARAAQFYGDRANEVKQAIGKLIDEGTEYRNFNFKDVNADTGTVTITCEYVTGTATDPNKEVTFRWKNVEGNWVLEGNP